MAFKRTRQHREHNRICDFLTNEKQGHSQVVGLSYIQMVSPLVLLQLCQLGGPLRQLGAPLGIQCKGGLEDLCELIPIQIGGAIIAEQLGSHSFHHPRQDGNSQHLPLLGAAVKVQFEGLKQTHQSIQAILNSSTILEKGFAVNITSEVFPAHFEETLQSSHRF